MLSKRDCDAYAKSGALYWCTIYKYQTVPMFLDYDKLMQVFIDQL